MLTGAYALGPISGGHFNPAVSVGLALGGRFKASELPGYVVAQVLGAIAAAAVLYLIATGKPGADIGGFATNGYGEHSPGGYGLMAAVVTEVVLTAIFLIVILGATAKRAASGFGGLAIGMCLTLIHLISIPVTNTSVNPARSTGPALFGPAYVPSPAERARCDASGHNTKSDSARQDGKSGSSPRHREHKAEALSTPCLSEKPSSPFHERLREPGTLRFLLQPFPLFVANRCFRSCGRILECQMRNPEPARPCRGLQDRGIQAVNPAESSTAVGSNREGDAPAEPPCCRWDRTCKRGSTGVSPSRDERGHSGRPPEG